jgi:phosphohistidine phosphatase
MRLLIVRHAIAAERGAPGMSDDERPLTPDGKKRFRIAAKGLARIMPRPDVVFTSPLIRARQTAEIAVRAWGNIEPVDLEALATGDVDGLAEALSARKAEESVAIVGHEPHVSVLLARLVGSSQTDRFSFRKGGVVLVDLSGCLKDGGQLVWFLPPKVLRALAE